MLSSPLSQFQTMPSDPKEAKKLELLKMRTIERRAKQCEIQRFYKAQVSLVNGFNTR